MGYLRKRVHEFWTESSTSNNLVEFSFASFEQPGEGASGLILVQWVNHGAHDVVEGDSVAKRDASPRALYVARRVVIVEGIRHLQNLLGNIGSFGPGWRLITGVSGLPVDVLSAISCCSGSK